MLMNKNGQVENIIGVIIFSVMFIVFLFLFGSMELESGFVSNILNDAVSSVSGMNDVSFVIKLIVPLFFLASLIFFVIYVRGALNGI